MWVSKIQIRNRDGENRRSSSAANPPHNLQRDAFKGTNQLLTKRELWDSLPCDGLFHNHLWGFATMLLLMRSFPGTTRDPGLGVGSRRRTLQCPDMSRALLCHTCSMCLFLPSPESLKWGVTPLCKLQSGWMLQYRSWSFFVGRPWHLPFFYKAKLTLSLSEITETHPFAKSGLTPAVDGGASISALFSLAGAAQAAEKHHRGPSHALQRLQLHTLESKATAQRQFLPTASN